MKLNYANLKSSISQLTTGGLLLFTCNSMAGPGTLSDIPLQTSSSSEANIMFLLDDSGSMNSFISGTTTRWDALETSMDTLLNSLTGVNVGLATFDTDVNKNGGDIIYPLTLLDQSDAADFATKVSAMNTIIAAQGGHLGGNSTIPAEALLDVGRYFANDASGNCGGSAGANLTIHPDSELVADGGLKEDVACTALLGEKSRIVGQDEAVTASCQKNFVVLMSDGLTRQDYHLRSEGSDRFKTHPGDTDTTAVANGEHPFWDYDQDCTTIPDDDGDTLPDWTCGTSTTNQRDNKVGGTKNYTYDGNGTDYLDDVAQALYEIDLRPDYNDYKNNITTYTVGFSDASLDPASGSFNPLMRSAALQGGGTYTYATDSASLTSAFNDITTTIVEQTSTSAAVTFNSSTLSSQSAVYLALFNTSRWGGELRSIPLDPFSGDLIYNCTAGHSNCWKASDQMENQDATSDGQANGGRNIITYNAGSNRGVAFRMPTSLFTPGDDALTNNFPNLVQTTTSTEIPLAMVKDLCAGGGADYDCSATGGAAQTDAQNFLNAITAYFRGDRSQEGSSTTYKFRQRTSKLGDLVHSSPVFVGEPESGWPSTGLFPADGDTTNNNVAYSTWAATSVKDRTKVVYVASNDGMLHGFRTEESSSGAGDAGEEVLAYIPTTILNQSTNEGMHYLADPSYGHKFYNDLTPVVTDVYMKYRVSGGGLVDFPDPDTDSTNDRAWRTVLLGGQRSGGRGIYLLDITDPDKFTEADADEVVMWEFTHDDLGYSFSQPTIAMMNNGKFAAIFGNGYSSGEDGGSGDCKAKLFVVYLEGGLDGTWTSGTDYEVYDTGYGSVPDGTPANANNCNGMSTPTVADLDGNGTADRIYAGDLHGNLWAFDMCKHDGTACTTSGWGNADATNGYPIMVAHTGTGGSAVRQPITSQPAIAFDPAGDPDAVDLIIVFGTGQYLTDGDKSTTSTQSLYAVRDYDALTNGRAGGGGDGFALSPRGGSTKFVEQTMATDSTACGGDCVARYISTTNSVGTSKVGWFIDLDLVSGERIVVDPVVLNDTVFFNTLIPDNATCSYGGSGFLMFVDLETGGTPADSVFDLDGSGEIGDAGDLISSAAAVGLKVDTIPSKSAFLGNYQYTSMSGGGVNGEFVRKDKTKGDDDDGARTGRMSWRELYDND